MIVVGLVLVAGVWLFFRRRAHHKEVTAGLTAERPVFSVEPPPGRLGKRKHEAL